MPDFNKTYLYRMTHIENIPHVIQFGITHSLSPNANSNYVPIGDGNLIESRSKFVLWLMEGDLANIYPFISDLECQCFL